MIQITKKNAHKILACLNTCKGIGFSNVEKMWNYRYKDTEYQHGIKEAELRKNFEYFLKREIPFSVSFIMRSVYPELTEAEEADLEERNEPKNGGNYYISNFFDFTSECMDSKRVKAAFEYLGITQNLITEWRSCDYEYTCTDEMGNEVEEDDEDCVCVEWRIYCEIEIEFCF